MLRPEGRVDIGARLLALRARACDHRRASRRPARARRADAVRLRQALALDSGAAPGAPSGRRLRFAEAPEVAVRPLLVYEGAVR